jgi:hypothetical protein
VVKRRGLDTLPEVKVTESTSYLERHTEFRSRRIWSVVRSTVTWANLNNLPFRLRAPNVVVEWLTSLLRIQKVPVSNFDHETGYPEGFRGFSQPLRINAGIIS